MKIAVSADCFASFTSGFPVRGMMLELIKQNQDISFQLYYTKREWPSNLLDFYQKINSMPNVEVRYFKDTRKYIAIKRLLGLKYVSFDSDVDLFLNPGNPEFIRGYKGPSICSLADLSTIKGISSNKYAFFFKHWVKYQWRKTLPWTTKIVTISDYTRKDVVEYFPEVQNRITTIHNGIDDHWFDSERTNPNVAKEFGIDGDYFIWWGLISRRKNIDSLIKAYRLARSQNESLPKLLLVGKVADYMQYLNSEFDDNIINIGFQDDKTLKALVAGSSGLVFPSLYEGFGLPVIEAFSQGVNVACSDITSLPEVAGGNAILFNPVSINSISNAIIELADKPKQSKLLQEYAKRFTYSHAADAYSKIVEEIVR